MLPPFLQPGDRIAILSPASAIAHERIDGAAATLRRLGYEPVVMPHAKGVYGSFSGTVEERLSDLTSALTAPSVKAILCSRGGYGCVHLLQELDKIPAGHFNKWLIGFSDITALHALWARKGYASLHASMAKAFAAYGTPEAITGLDEEIAILQGENVTIQAHSDGSQQLAGHSGKAHAPVLGGNLAVLGGLIGTSFDPLAAAARRGEDFILLVEDIAEPIYKVERILYQLLLTGSLDHMKGLIAGDFTEYRPSRDHAGMQQMIEAFIARNLRGKTDIPVTYSISIGHRDEANYPVILNWPATLEVTAGNSYQPGSTATTLTFG